jgi:hypothetical protein
MRQEFLYISYYNKSRVYTSAKSRARFTRKIAYHVIIVGSVSILKINIWIYVFAVIYAIKHSVCITYQHVFVWCELISAHL